MTRWGAPLALLVALVGLFATDLDAVERAVLRGVMQRELVRLAALANLSTAAQAGATPKMPVEVVADGGPPWTVELMEAAVDADPIFTRGGPHLLQVQLMQYGPTRTRGVRAQLWRQGWSLRAPQPQWVSPAPWVVLLSLLAGAGWAGLRRRLAGGWLVAGLAATGLMAALPWPPQSVRPPLSEQWREGPLGHAVIELARGLPDISVAAGAGVVTLCLVLMLFDHRRSPGQGGGLVAAGLLGVMGLALWLEAALRGGLGAWLQQPAGWIAMVGALGLWAWAWQRRAPSASTEPEASA